MNTWSSVAALITASLITVAAQSAWSDEMTPNAPGAPAMQTPVQGWYPPSPGRGGYPQPWQQSPRWPTSQRGYGQVPPHYPPRGQYGVAPGLPTAAENPLSAELRQTQEQLATTTAELDKAYATLEQMRVTLERSLETQEALFEKMTTITSEQQALQAELQTATQALQQAQAESTTSSRALSESKTQAETLRNEVAELKTQLENQQAALHNTKQTLAAERDQLRRDLASRDEQLASVQAGLQSATQALQQAQVESTTSSQVLSESKAQAETLNSEVAELKAQLNNQRAETATSSQALSNAKARAETLNTELAKLKTQLESQQTALHNTEQSLAAERDQLRRDLASRDEQLATVRAGLQSAAQTLQQAQAESTASSEALSESKTQAETLRNEVAELRTQLENQQTALQDAEKRLADVIAERDGLQADLAARNQELTQAQAALTTVQSEVDELRQARTAATEVVAAPAAGAPDSAQPAAGETLDAGTAEIAALQTAGPDSDGDGVPDSMDLCRETRQGVAVESTGCADGVAISLDGVTFSSDSYELTDEARRSLDRVAGILAQHSDLRLQVAGHTNAKADPAHNQWLSLQRAQAVRDYLVAQGVDPAHIGAVGYGSQRPIADNTTREGQRMNQRIELRSLR
jgi:OOP family OmpA-OmpF porin